jgi:hypothetical protein
MVRPKRQPGRSKLAVEPQRRKPNRLKPNRLKPTDKSGCSIAALKALRLPKTLDRPRDTALPKTSHPAEHGTKPYAATRKMRRRPQDRCTTQDSARREMLRRRRRFAKQEAVSQTTSGALHETPQPDKGRARDNRRRSKYGILCERRPVVSV